MTFKDNKYVVVRDVLSKDTLSLLQYQSKMLEDIMCYNFRIIIIVIATCYGSPIGS